MEPPSRPRHRRPSVSKNGLQVLHAALGLIESDQPSPVIIAIDCENTCNVKHGFRQSQNCQLGIATFDTNILTRPFQRGQKFISTQNYVSGSEDYTKKASNKFAFGKSTVIRPTELVQRIDKAVPKDRPVILLGHAVRNELEVLHVLGSSLGDSVSEIVDTFRVANDVFEFWAGSLGDLLTLLGSPFDRLHSAGNDANCTLKAALLLVAKGYPDQEHAALGRLRQIASPSATAPILRYDAVKKTARQKWKERTRKFRSKTWTLEEQNEIREQRAAKRAEAEKARLP